MKLNDVFYYSPMIEAMIREGKSVPPGITMEILQKAMVKSGNDKFILDGFPRDEEIRKAFEAAVSLLISKYKDLYICLFVLV